MRKLDLPNLKLIGSLFVLVFLFTSIAITVKLTPQQREIRPRAAESQTFVAINPSGMVSYTRDNLNPPDPSGGCYADVWSWHGLVGQTKGSNPVVYGAYRTYLMFDTSSIPDDAIITSACLKFYLETDQTSPDFYVKARRLNWGPSLDCGDWQAAPPNEVGSYYTSGLPGVNSSFTISLNTSYSDLIKKTEPTGFYLASNLEEADNPPGGAERVWVYLNHQSYPGYKPTLTVEFTVPAPLPTPNIKANGSDGPITIGYNTSANISWTSSNATSCSVSPTGWAGTANSGISTGNLTSTTTYRLSCTGPGGTKEDSVTVNVSPKPGDGTKPKDGQKPQGGILNTIQLTISVPYLVGEIKIPVKIGSFSKEIELSPDKKDYPLDVKEANITIGNPFTLVVGGNRTLIKKINSKVEAESMVATVGDLILGDITGDNKIDDKDSLALLDSIAKQTLKGDLNADKVTNSLDWAILLANFGKAGDL